MTHRAQANKRIRELRQEAKKKPAVLSGFAEVADASRLEVAEERPAKRLQLGSRGVRGVAVGSEKLSQ